MLDRVRCFMLKAQVYSSYWVMFLFVCLLTGCAGSIFNPITPKFEIIDYELVDISFTKQKYIIKLRISNENNFKIPIERMQYNVSLNNKPLASGLRKQGMILPAKGSRIVNLNISSQSRHILNQLIDLRALATKPIKYRITGKLKITNMRKWISFQYKGLVRL